MKRSRRTYAALILFVVALGLASRSSLASQLPGFLSTYAGDTLWALMVFLIIGFCFPSLKTSLAAAAAITFSFGIEFSQLYQADWINQLRGNRFGALVLGAGFLWSDLICYTVGVFIGAIGESSRTSQN